jgi:KUP system potassium uptake protein
MSNETGAPTSEKSAAPEKAAAKDEGKAEAAAKTPEPDPAAKASHGRGLGRPAKKAEAKSAEDDAPPPAKNGATSSAEGEPLKKPDAAALTSGTHDLAAMKGGANRTHHHHHGGSVAKLALAALGVVYGDIGTSPLYALRECFTENAEITTQRADVLGLLSLFFWAMALVVSFKYVLFITRADNDGEGGILALLALVLPKRTPGKVPLIVGAGLFGAALLLSEGMLTPAISVLSAVEGIRGIAPGLGTTWVIGISLVILISLFLVQRRGTGGVGLVFGPIMLVWFITLAALGAYWLSSDLSVLWAIDPRHAMRFFMAHGVHGFLVLGSVALCITGVEALYADMGHFGRTPIKNTWRYFVWPALVLNYFGQGALLIAHPEHAGDSFFAMVGEGWPRIPLVVLATAATVIASQALISGAFSLARMGIQLGYLPRLQIRHTSGEHEGQIYVPEINWMLMVACIALVLGFQSSSAMAAAYGIAVTGTMSITTVLFFLVARRWWGVRPALLLCGAMWAVDLTFFAANLVKVASGGWIPLVTGTLILFTMTTWKLGRDRVGKFLKNRSEPLEEFLDQVHDRLPVRVKGTAVFMTSTSSGTPPVLLHHFKHNQVLHSQVVLLSIVGEDVPIVARDKRVSVEKLREGFYRVTAHYGFMQTPKVIDILRACEKMGLHTRKDDTSFYLGREKLVITRNPGLGMIRKFLFSFLSRNARPATDFFEIPPERVVEMGMQLEL